MLKKVKMLKLARRSPGNCSPLVRKTPGSLGWDIVYPGPQLTLKAGQILKLDTGFSLQFPAGTFATICSRSGMALEGVIVLNAPGVIDTDYTGEIGVILMNVSQKDYEIFNNQRIAQLLLFEKSGVELHAEEEDATDPTKMRDGGFGSTGR